MNIESAFSLQSLSKELRRAAMGWLATKYAHMGTAKGNWPGAGGVDCTKLIGLIFAEIGVFTEIEQCYYDRDWYITGDVEVMLQAFSSHCEQHLAPDFDFVFMKYRPGMRLEIGDVVCFAVKHRGLCNHTALVVEENKIIHAIEGPGVHVADFNDYWKEKARFVYRIISR